MGRVRSFDVSAQGSASDAAEAAIAKLFVAARIGQLAFAGLILAGDRKRFARPKTQAVLFAAATVESAWICARVLRARRYRDRRAMWIDTVACSLGLLANEAALGGGEGGAWMKNLAIGSSIAAAAAPTATEATSAMGVLGGAAIIAGLRARGNDAHVAGPALAINDAISWSGMHAATGIYLRSHRRYAASRDRADDVAVARASAAASGGERARQHELLHGRTVEVLDNLARAGEIDAATALARREAARLRHALRTGGNPPEGGLDDALFDVAQAMGERGQRVDLVTAELTAAIEPSAVEVIADGVHQALLAATEFGAAEKAVVRAASTGESVHASVRDHGRGFAPGTASAYEADLQSLVEWLRARGVAASVWSAPGRGVRLSLEIGLGAIVEDGEDHTFERFPRPAGGESPHRDDELPLVDDDVERPSRPVGLRTAQHEVDRTGFDHVDASDAGEALEPGAQQRDSRDDACPGSRSHTNTLTPEVKIARGSPAPFVPKPRRESRPADSASTAHLSSLELDVPVGDELLLAERTIMAAALAWRATGLATGLSAVIAGRDRFRSPRWSWVQLAGAAVESAWVVTRLRGQARWRDPAVAGLEIATAVTALASGRANLHPGDQGTWLHWAPWSFASNAVCGQAMANSPLDAAVAGAAAIGVAMVSPGPTRSDVIANSAALGAFFVGARILAAQIRRDASGVVDARADAMAEGARLAADHERLAQLRLLHDSAVQTLEAVGSGQLGEVQTIRTLAETEAARLRSALQDRNMSASGDLGVALTELVTSSRYADVRIDVDVPLTTTVSPAVRTALVDACGEALTNVVKHANVDHATVTVTISNEEVQLVVRDEGNGYDTNRIREGFGLLNSIRSRLAVVGGAVHVESAPGRGTTITLRAPA